MGRVLTNNTSLQYAIEASPGVLPGSPEWRVLEPNSYANFGATIETVPRDPINRSRQRRKGAITDLDSGLEFETDLTLSVAIDFLEAYVFAQFVDGEIFIPTSITATSYVVPAGTALAEGTLVFARDTGVVANNGLKAVAAGATTTDIPVDGGLTIDAGPLPTNVEVAVTGFEFPTGDLEVDVNGDLITTTTDFTTLGLNVGQFIFVGGESSSNQFALAVNYGYARIVSIATNLLVLDKRSQVFAIDNGAGQDIQVFFGRFLRNVAVGDADFISRSLQFELNSPNLGNDFEYSIGNFGAVMTLNLPLTDKATVTWSFIGLDTEVPVGTQKTNADTPILPNRTGAFGTAADFGRLRLTELDETGISTDFKSLTLVLDNNVSPEKVLDVLGAKFINNGNINIDAQMELLFTDDKMITAIRNNETVTMDFSLRNLDGAMMIDLPTMDITDGSRNFNVNESVTINITGQTFGESSGLDTSISFSMFPFAPLFPEPT